MPTLPRRLQTGDTVALVAPASAPADPGAIDQSVDRLKAMGFKVKLPRNARKRLGYLAGTDRERAADLMSVFSDSAVKAIFCVRGGYGCGRLLELLDYKLIKRNAKIFVGYSDITALHCAMLVKSSLLTFHGPMLASDFIKPEFTKFSETSWRQTLSSTNAPGRISAGYEGKTMSILRRGKAEGGLIGGNLSVLCTVIGTPWQPRFRGQILFLEDIDEPPYRFDRFLTHLLSAGLLQQVAGVAVGICENCEDPKAKAAKEYRQSLMDVLRDRLLPLKVPVVCGLPFGHVMTNATLPVGGNAILDANRGELILTTPCVR